MSLAKSSIVEADITGRVMALEQRTKGLYGRIVALEARLSSAGNGLSDMGLSAREEFVPAAVELDMPEMPPGEALDGRLSALEKALQQVDARMSERAPARAIDTTGLIAGAIMIAAGLLLFAGNLELLKNPLAVVGCGVLLIGGALWRTAF